QLCEDHCVRVADLGLPVGRPQSIPVGRRHPVRACEVRRGIEAFALEQVRRALAASREGDDAVRIRRQVDQGEHLSADSLVANPEDEIVPPLQRLGHVRQREEKGPGSLGIHAEEYRRGLLPASCQEICGSPLIYFEETCLSRTPNPILTCSRLSTNSLT